MFELMEDIRDYEVGKGSHADQVLPDEFYVCGGRENEDGVIVGGFISIDDKGNCVKHRKVVVDNEPA